MRNVASRLLVLGLQVLTVLGLQAGTITVENKEPDTVTVTVRQNGTTKDSRSFAANETFTFNSGNITAGVDCEIRYTYTGVTRTAGTWPEGAGNAQIPSSRFNIRVINNTGSAVDPRVRRNGAEVNNWADIAPGGSAETGAPGWSDFWFGGGGTYTVRNAYNSTDANPTIGLATADYVQGFGATPGQMVFTFGSATYDVTRCIKNQYLNDVWGVWWRDGVQVYREKIPPGQTVCKTWSESAGVSHSYAEFVEFWVTTTDGQGNLNSDLVSQTAGALNANTGSQATNNYNGPALPAGTTAGPIAQSNFVGSGSSAALGFTNTNLGGGASEGTSQAGFNGVISAVNASADKITGAVITTGDKIVDALGGFGNGTNNVFVSVTNTLSVTNIGDTNLVTRWDAWTNAGEASRATFGNVTNLVTTLPTHESIATGQGTLSDFEGLATGPSVGTGSAGNWVIAAGGYSFDLNPMNHPDVAALMIATKGWVRFLVYFVFVLAVFKRLDAVMAESMTTEQTRIPNVQVLGNSVGAIAAPAYVALVATLMLAVLAGLLVIAQSYGAAFTFLGTDPFAGASGPVGMSVWLANQCLPLDTIVALSFAFLGVLWQSRSILWASQIVIRLLVA